jgi:hypothetical protein
MPRDAQSTACALPCGFSHLEMSIEGDRVRLRGDLRSLVEWRALADVRRAKPKLERRVAVGEHAIDEGRRRSRQLELAGLKARLSVANGWPVLENAPAGQASLDAAAQALRPHLPLLHELLGAAP